MEAELGHEADTMDVCVAEPPVRRVKLQDLIDCGLLVPGDHLQYNNVIGEINENGISGEIDGSAYWYAEVIDWAERIHEHFDLLSSKSTKARLFKTNSTEIIIPNFLFAKNDAEIEKEKEEAEKRKAQEKEKLKEEEDAVWKVIKVDAKNTSKHTLAEHKEHYLALLENRPYAFAKSESRFLHLSKRFPPLSTSYRNLLDNEWLRPESIPATGNCTRPQCLLCTNPFPQNEDPWAELVQCCLYYLKSKYPNEDYFSVEHQLIPLAEDHLYKIDSDTRAFAGLNWKESVIRAATNKTHWDIILKSHKIDEKRGIMLAPNNDPYS